MVVRVAPDFRGNLSLTVIARPVQANAPISLTDEQFWTADVQLAIQKGWLVVEGDFPLKDMDDLEKYKVKNPNAIQLVIVSNDMIFQKNEYKILTKRQVERSDIQDALRMGKLEIIDKVADVPVVIEKSKDVKTSKKVVSKIKKPTKEEEEKFSKRPKEADTTMQAWDGQAEKLVDKNDTNKQHFKHVEKIAASEDLEVQVGNINFEKAKKTKSKKVRSRTKVSKKRSKKVNGRTKVSKKGSKKESSKKKAIEPVGRRRPEAKADAAFIDANNMPNEIGFVDQEQEAERARKAGLNVDVDLE